MEEKKFYSIHWFENFQAALLWDDGTWERIDIPVIPGKRGILKLRYWHGKTRTEVIEHINEVLKENEGNKNILRR